MIYAAATFSHNNNNNNKLVCWNKLNYWPDDFSDV